MKKTIRDFDLNNKKVIIRVDFNVPMKDSVILDDNRIRESLDTINYAINNGAKVILMSHLGRVKTVYDKDIYSLESVALRLSELLDREVIFVDECMGDVLESEVNSLKSGDVLLMENTRFMDIDSKRESGNDSELGAYWASLADIFINDAFGTCHRAHASNVGIASHLPNGIGFLVEKEINMLGGAVNNPVRPFGVILGGAKVSDKTLVVSNLVLKADYILIGGGMAFTFLKAMGYNIGKSLVDMDNIGFCKDILSKYPDKIILPDSIITTTSIENKSDISDKDVSCISSDDIGVDIGNSSIKKFSNYLNRCKTILWNGPVGMFEISEFSNGTLSLCDILSRSDATTILGGGDTASAAINMGYKESFSHISTGGGASLEFLEGNQLPGIEVIDDV